MPQPVLPGSRPKAASAPITWMEMPARASAVQTLSLQEDAATPDRISRKEAPRKRADIASANVPALTCARNATCGMSGKTRLCELDLPYGGEPRGDLEEVAKQYRRDQQ